MNNQNLIQLIRESIQNYISEIDHAGENAACEAKINAIGEAITLREKKMNMDGLDEAYHDMLDKGKMKELASEIKVLKKSLAKYEKQLEKLKSKGNKSTKVEDTEKKEIVDEVTLPEDEMNNEYENMGMEEDMNIQEVLYMQKIAGIITEDEFIAKLEEANTPHEFLTVIKLNKATTQEYFDYIVNSARNLYDFEVNSADFDQKEITIYGDHADVFKKYSNINSIKVLDGYDDDEFDMNEAKKPSAGMTKKEKSAVAKKAHAGKDIGKKGKNFEKIEKAAGGGEKGKKIAAATMWKSQAKK